MSTNETQIIVDEHAPTVRIIREFDAPPSRVFQAHVEPELVVQWLGPRGHEMHIDRYECVTGGSYRYTHTADGEEYGFFGSFHDVRPDTTIVQTFTFEGMPDAVTLDRFDLEDLGDGRTRLVSTTFCDSFESRDGLVASGMETGIIEGFERLDELLAG